ncbi:MAG: hypothetical protein M1830_003044 [Pleopsidium flavum]|nr:MAG: hypothetical protein M1830_003044 [Pleopsidium flavum]
MKSSGTLSLRALTSKIHPPLPLTPRESQQLLSLLTSSFRKQLNREHPSMRADDDIQARRRAVNNSYGKSVKARSTSPFSSTATTSSLWSTDHHLQSILKNPLFSASPEAPRRSLPSQFPIHHKDLEEAQSASFDPMAWFEGTVASGSATIAGAKYSLQTLCKILTSSSVASVKHAMAKSGAGSKVQSWLWSSGLEESFGFLKDYAFTAVLTQYLVAERRHDVLWKWMHRLMSLECQRIPEESQGVPLSPTRAARSLLLHLVTAETNHGDGVRAAVGHFLKIAGSKGLETVSPQQESTVKKDAPLAVTVRPAGAYLAYVLTKSGRSSTLDSETYERFTRSTSMWSCESLYYQAKLQLHHPETPSADTALHYLKHISNLRPSTSSTIWPKDNVFLFLDSARLLLQQERYDDGALVMDFLRKNYAAELGIAQAGLVETATKDTERIGCAFDELSNLQLLGSLDSR